jgi:hypothetical protein
MGFMSEHGKAQPPGPIESITEPSRVLKKRMRKLVSSMWVALVYKNTSRLTMRCDDLQ